MPIMSDAENAQLMRDQECWEEYLRAELMGDAELMTDARDWLADCTFRDVEPEEFATMAPERIARGVDRHYDGGLCAFLRDLGR